jgi:predicted enzyme related to lactoylglutathione lyase
MVHGLAATQEFYGELFGWEAKEASDDAEETGGYRMFLKDDKQVAGLMPIQQEGQPPSWNTYISVSDADDIAEKVKEAGGEVIVEPMDVLDLGRMAFFTDPTGAAIGAWQANQFPGAGLVNEPGTLNWNELATRDIEAAQAFYPAVFGWTPGRPSFEAPETYTIWELDGRPVGGMSEMTEEFFPPDVPPHWGVCFAVADCDATVAKARELGATVAAEPMSMPIGRFAGLVDPQGAPFAVMQLAWGG